MFNINIPNGEWSRFNEDDDDVLARFQDGEHSITVLTVNDDEKGEYMNPSVVQTSPDEAIVIVSDRGLHKIMQFQMKILQDIPDIEERCSAAFATTLGLFLMLGTHKLASAES